MFRKICLLLTTLCSALCATPQASNVIVVANKNNPVSLEIAEYYMAKREIPKENLFLLDTSDEQEIGRREFSRTILNPLRRALIESGWLQGELLDSEDEFGRLEMKPKGHKIDFLVTCHIPLKIKNFDTENKGPQGDEAAVDSELSLMAQINSPLRGAIRNPLFGKFNPSDNNLDQIIRVSRLHSPSKALTKQLIDSAMTGETYGLRGRAYIDKGGPVPEGDKWLGNTKQLLDAANFVIDEESTKKQFDTSDRFDAPAIYFGWYSFRPIGMMRVSETKLTPGAIALHIHSFSCREIESKLIWAPELIIKGAAFTMGNVYEPYLGYTHRPDAFLQALMMGKTTGEAAYIALSGVGWQAIALGDPLYQPFKENLDKQFKRVLAGDIEDPELDSYILLTAMNAMKKQGKNSEALSLANKLYTQMPSAALTLELLQAGEPSENVVTTALEFLTLKHKPEVQTFALLADIAEECQKLGYDNEAIAFYSELLSSSKMKENYKPEYLTRASKVAGRAGIIKQASQWQLEKQSIEDAIAAKEAAKKAKK